MQEYKWEMQKSLSKTSMGGGQFLSPFCGQEGLESNLPILASRPPREGLSSTFLHFSGPSASVPCEPHLGGWGVDWPLCPLIIGRFLMPRINMRQRQEYKEFFLNWKTEKYYNLSKTNMLTNKCYVPIFPFGDTFWPPGAPTIILCEAVSLCPKKLQILGLELPKAAEISLWIFSRGRRTSPTGVTFSSEKEYVGKPLRRMKVFVVMGNFPWE